MMSAPAPRPQHWTGSIYSRFSVVNIPLLLAGRANIFISCGPDNVCVATRACDQDKKGTLHMLHALYWPLVVLAAEFCCHPSLPKCCRIFPRRLTDGGRVMASLPRSLHYGQAGDIGWGRHNVVTTGDDTSASWHLSGHHSPWCNMITLPHSSHRITSLSQEIFASNSSDHCCLTRLGITKCFQFFDILNCACAILAFAVKITTLYISKRLLGFIFIIIYSWLRQCCPGWIIYLSYMTLGEWRTALHSALSAVCRTIHDEPQSL